jgi:hypothetical protein
LDRGATRLGEIARTFYGGDESADVMLGTRFAMNLAVRWGPEVLGSPLIT